MSSFSISCLAECKVKNKAILRIQYHLSIAMLSICCPRVQVCFLLIISLEYF
jgi:hypothetical protein